MIILVQCVNLSLFGCFSVSFLGNICTDQACSFSEYFEKGFEDLVKAIKGDRFDAGSLTKSLQVFELLWQYLQENLTKKTPTRFFSFRRNIRENLAKG